MEKRYETREMPSLFTRAAIGSIDAEAREFDVVFATNSEVPMWNWDRGSHLEILDMNAESVRLDRINSGAPLLDNHDSVTGMRSVLGKVIEGSAKVDGEKAIARVKFSRKPESEGAWMDIQDGIVKTLSVGYSVFRASLEDKEKKLYRATDWEPFEISMAPIPADINATVREKESKNNVEVEMIEDYQNDLDYVQTIKARYKNY